MPLGHQRLVLPLVEDQRLHALGELRLKVDANGAVALAGPQHLGGVPEGAELHLEGHRRVGGFKLPYKGQQDLQIDLGGVAQPDLAGPLLFQTGQHLLELDVLPQEDFSVVVQLFPSRRSLDGQRGAVEKLHTEFLLQAVDQLCHRGLGHVIFLGGLGVAKQLKREKYLIPSVYALRKGFRKPTKQAVRGDYLWDTSLVRKILKNQEYVGDVLNFRTYSKSYKLKERLENPREKWEIHKDVHEAIIPREDWELIQKTFGDTKYRKPKHIEKNMFCGYLKCSDCGANLNYKYTHDNPDNHYFSCRNKRAGNGLCSKTHHIRVDVITELVRRNLSEIVRFAAAFEDEFVKIVMDEQYKQIQIQQRKNQETLQTLLARNREVDVLYEKLFEEKILGSLTEDRFKKLSEKYEDEQAELTQRIRYMKKVVAEEQKHELNAEGFLQLVRKYTDIQELTPKILREFIDKVVVHHREKQGKETIQQVDIYYRFIGHVELPKLSKPQQEAYLLSLAKVLKTLWPT